MNRPRGGFTLIELMVVMALIALLAGLTVAFLPSVNERERAARGATMLQGFLNTARQRAFQRRSIVGLRFLDKNGNGLITDFQYLEKPDDFTDKSAPGAVAVLTTSANGNTFQPSGNALQMDIRAVDLLNGYSATPADQPFWTVQPGDTLEIMGVGLVHRIMANGVTNLIPTAPVVYSTVLLESSPDPFIPRWDIQVTGNPSGGTYTLTVQMNVVGGSTVSGTTIAIPYNASAAAVQNTLDTLLQGTLFPTLTNPVPRTQVTPAGGAAHVAFMIPTFVQFITVTADPSKLVPQAGMMPPVPGVNVNAPNSIQPFPYFRIMRAPRVAGEEQLQLPKNVVVDFTTNGAAPVPNPLPRDPLTGNLDILFTPSGAVITNPGTAQDFLGLWVRDTTGSTIFEIGPTIMAVHVRTGLVASHPPDDNPADNDWYKFVRDGRSN